MNIDTQSYKSITAVQALPAVETPELFKPGQIVDLSPIDQFITNTTAINLVYLPFNTPGTTWQTELGTLVVLGYMSAIESYFRAVISGLIQIGETTRALAGPRNVSFAAATHSSGEGERVLSEALLEHISFSTAGEIEKALRDIVGLKSFSSEVTTALAEFKKLCQLRHCCVHRFGKLGSQNALALGFDRHKLKIEHPFSPTVSDVETIADALQIIVKTLNNFLFTAAVDRAVMNSLADRSLPQWSWKFRSDRKRFKKYYDLFAITYGSPKSPEEQAIYCSLRAHHANMVRSRTS